MTATHRTYDNEPSWCRLVEHHSAVGRHFSTELRAGDRREAGELGTWLLRTGDGPTKIVVCAAHMASASVDLSLADAAAHRDHLTRLLKLAGYDA